jgi:hypothetical protein
MYHASLEKILDDDKEFEDIAAKRSPHRAETLAALEIVKKFIVSKKLIIYGGMAIDYALKHAGHVGIYTDETIPDYDFISPNFFEDSIELTDILFKAGYGTTSAVNAIHITTRKVRVNFEWVADITYYPQNIFDSIPYLEYNGLRFVPPSYQLMDMHIELCYPYDNPPWEVLRHRTRKTIKRFKLMNEVHPMKISDKQFASSVGGATQMTIPMSALTGPDLVDGVVAYALLHKIIFEMFINSESKLGKSIFKTGVINSDIFKEWESIWNPKLEISSKEITLIFSSSPLTLFHTPKTRRLQTPQRKKRNKGNYKRTEKPKGNKGN